MGLLVLAAGLVGAKIVTNTAKHITNNKNKTKKEIENQRQQATLELEHQKQQATLALEQQRQVMLREQLAFENQKAKNDLEAVKYRVQGDLDKKRLEMNKNVFKTDAIYSIKCISCHAVLRGYPYRDICCSYCDTVQSITDNSKLI